MPPDASFMHSWEHDAGVYKVIHDNSTRDSTLAYPSRDGGNRYQRSMDTRAYRCADRANYSSSRQLNPLPPRNGTTVFPCFSHGSRDARNYRGTWKGASEISPLKTDAIIKRPSGLSLRLPAPLAPWIWIFRKFQSQGGGERRKDSKSLSQERMRGEFVTNCDNNGVLNGRGKSLYGRIKWLSWKGRGSNSGEVVSL